MGCGLQVAVTYFSSFGEGHIVYMRGPQSPGLPSLILLFYYGGIWHRRCHCTRQLLVYGCSPHSPVLHPACGLLKCQMQFTAVLSDHVNPSFLLSSPLSDFMYIAVVCYFGVSFILHPIQMSKVS